MGYDFLEVAEWGEMELFGDCKFFCDSGTVCLELGRYLHIRAALIDTGCSKKVRVECGNGAYSSSFDRASGFGDVFKHGLVLMGKQV